MKRFLLPWILAALVLPSDAFGVDRWALQFFGGAPYNLNLPLTIRQSGSPTIHLTGNFDTRPFEVPYYYAWRIGGWTESRGWELELIHSKLYLRNRPPQVQEFSISHGYNLLTVNRAWARRGFIFRAGAGAVVTHPETTIRGRPHPQSGGPFGGGYHISGPTIQGAVEKRFRPWRWIIVSLEAKLTATYARIPVEGGHADVPNMAAHALFGLGLER